MIFFCNHLIKFSFPIHVLVSMRDIVPFSTWFSALVSQADISTSQLKFDYWQELGLGNKDAQKLGVSIRRFLDHIITSSSVFDANKIIETKDYLHDLAGDFLEPGVRPTQSKEISPGSRFWDPTLNKDQPVGFSWPKDKDQ